MSDPIGWGGRRGVDLSQYGLSIRVSELERAVYRSGTDSVGHPRVHGVGSHVPRDNLTATTSPAVTDDETEGYNVGSQWFDTSGVAFYLCLDGTAGAAVWSAIGSSGGLADHDHTGDVGDGGDLTAYIHASGGDEAIGGYMFADAGSPPAPDSTVHIWEGTAGAVSAAAGTVLTIENDGNAYINILTPNTTSVSGIYLGNQTDGAEHAGITYSHALDIMTFRVESTNVFNIAQTLVGVAAGVVLQTDTINETTAAAGVTIDGVLVKDNGITATGVLDFGGATSVEIPNGTGPTVDATGEIALDTDGDAATVTQGVLVAYDGTRTMKYFGVNGYPSSDNDVMAYDSATNAVTWQAQAGGGGGGHTIRENGTDQTARTGLNFIDASAGAGLITDDAVGDETEVNLDLYILASGSRAFSGAISHGTNDITGVDSLFIDEKASADADVAGDGQVWVKNTTPNALWFTDDAGTDWRVNNQQTITVSIMNPTATEDIGLAFFFSAVTVQETQIVVAGTGSPSCTIALKHSTDRSAAGNTLLAATAFTNTTTGTNTTSFTDATIPADSWLWLETSAIGGTTLTEVVVTIRFTYD